MNDRDIQKIETMTGLIRESTDDGLYAGRQEWSEADGVPDDLREAIVRMADEEIARRGLPALGEA